MSALREAVDRGMGIQFARVRPPPELAEKARNLPEAEAAEPDSERIERAIGNVRQGLLAGGPLRSRDLSLCAGALWHSEHALASEPGFAEPYARAVEAAPSSALRAVAKAYLHAYPASRYSASITGLLDRSVPKAQHGWLVAARDSRILCGDDAVPGLAQAALAAPQGAPMRPWRDAGLIGGLAASGYAASVFEAACEAMQAAPSQEGYEQLRDLLFYKEGEQDFQRFPDQAGTNAYVAALLGPWRKASPKPALRRWVRRELIEAFGDPRTEPQRWSGVSDDLVRILRRWLTEASLDQFLNIAGQHAEPRMWKYRRPFWTSYLESGAIQDAWVHFGRKAHRQADRLARTDEEIAGSYGFLDGGDADQSVLILRLGDHTVAEWTHNGKAWIWERSRGAPKPYQSTLTDTDCRGSTRTFGKVHGGAATYRWQHAVATELERLGIPRTDEREWRPN